MKRVEAVVRPDRVEDVMRALRDLGHHGVTVWEVRGHGLQDGVAQQWRGAEYRVDLLPKASVVAVVHDHEARDAAEAIAAAARTGLLGDGKIFISPVDEVIRIRTGETGSGTL